MNFSTNNQIMPKQLDMAQNQDLDKDLLLNQLMNFTLKYNHPTVDCTNLHNCIYSKDNNLNSYQNLLTSFLNYLRALNNTTIAELALDQAQQLILNLANKVLAQLTDNDEKFDVIKRCKYFLTRGNTDKLKQSCQPNYFSTNNQTKTIETNAMFNSIAIDDSKKKDPSKKSSSHNSMEDDSEKKDPSKKSSSHNSIEDLYSGSDLPEPPGLTNYQIDSANYFVDSHTISDQLKKLYRKLTFINKFCYNKFDDSIKQIENHFMLENVDQNYFMLENVDQFSECSDDIKKVLTQDISDYTSLFTTALCNLIKTANSDLLNNFLACIFLLISINSQSNQIEAIDGLAEYACQIINQLQSDAKEVKVDFNNIDRHILNLLMSESNSNALKTLSALLAQLQQPILNLKLQSLLNDLDKKFIEIANNASVKFMAITNSELLCEPISTLPLNTLEINQLNQHLHILNYYDGPDEKKIEYWLQFIELLTYLDQQKPELFKQNKPIAILWEDRNISSLSEYISAVEEALGLLKPSNFDNEAN